VRAAILLSRLKFSPGESPAATATIWQKQLQRFQSVSGLSAMGAGDAAYLDGTERSQPTRYPERVQQNSGGPGREGRSKLRFDRVQPASRPLKPRPYTPDIPGSPPWLWRLISSPCKMFRVRSQQFPRVRAAMRSKANTPGSETPSSQFESPLDLLAREVSLQAHVLLLQLNPGGGSTRPARRFKYKCADLPAAPGRVRRG